MSYPYGVSAKASLIALLAVTLLVLSGCASTGSSEPQEDAPPEPAANERMADRLTDMAPDARARPAAPELPPELDDMVLDTDPMARSDRFDVAATDVAMAQFLDDLGEIAGTNILLDGQVTGQVTLRLRNVTVQDVMQALQDQHNLAFERTRYGYRVSGDQLQTQMFRVNYLDVQRTGTSATGVSSGQQMGDSGQASQINTANRTDFWGTLETTLGMMMASGSDRQLVVNPQTGLIIVKGTPRELRAIGDFLYEAEIALQQQVIIEARVLEVRLSDSFEAGIDWDILGRASGVDGFNVSSSVSGNNFSAPPDGTDGTFNLSLNAPNFSAVIRALRSQGEVEVLSSPRISTVNNQKAVIKVGSEEQFVTVSSVASTDDDGVPILTPTFALEPYFSGIALDVTPQIADQNQIILHVHPSVIQVSATTKSFTIQGESYNLPLANSTIRETDSVVRAENGQVVVIGGLLQNSVTNLRSGLPDRGNGLLGRLFGQERRSNERTELIILLRPVVVENDTFGDDIEDTVNRLRRP